MVTLRIEHPITELGVWQAAFDRFAEARQKAGVRAHRVHQPVDDERYVLIDLELDTAEAAERFLGFLRANVWSNRDSSPGLAGAPQARILNPVG